MRIFTRHLLAVLLPVLLTAAAVSGWYAHSLRAIGVEHTHRDAEHLRAGLYREFEEHARSVAAVAAEALVSPLLYGDTRATAELLGSLRNDPDVIETYLVGADGRIRQDGTKDNATFNRRIEDVLDLPFSPHEDEHWDDARERLTIQTPIVLDEHIFGEVALVLTTRGISGRLRLFGKELRNSFDALYGGALLSLALLGSALLAASTIVAWTLARRLTRPIAELAATVRAYRSTGELPRSAAPERDDEIGDLARALNDTVHSLRQTTVSRDLLHSILETLRDAVLILDEHGTVLSANASAREMFGGRRPESMRAADLFVVPEELAEQWWRRVCTADLGDREEVSLPTDDGEPRTLLLSCAPLGDFGGYILAASDISERARLQQAMLRTEKMASVGGLAAGMAHEINNPLGVMMQSAQLMRRRLDPGIARNAEVAAGLGLDLAAVDAYLRERSIDRYLDGMIEAGARAASILNDMIRFSRPDESAYQPQSVNKTLDAALGAALRDGVESRWDAVEIVKDYASPMPAVPYSGTEIEQVFINLLRNAFQAASDGEGPPRVTLRTRFESGHAVAVVEDNGPGMDENTRRRAMEPFYTTRSVGQGTGLGLSLAYFVVTAHHGGELDVRSRPGRTAVTVRLPLTRAHPSGVFPTPSSRAEA